MKEIKAIVQPFMLEHVLDALAAIEGLPGVTISEVRGSGKTRAANVKRPVREAGHSFAPKSKLEIVVPNAMLDQVVDAIVQAARTGRRGDGKVFIHDLSDVVKIRTGDRGEVAIRDGDIGDVMAQTEGPAHVTALSDHGQCALYSEDERSRTSALSLPQSRWRRRSVCSPA